MWGNKVNDEAQPFRQHLHTKDNDERLIELLRSLCHITNILVTSKNLEI
jgi:hypothetical protein